MTDIITEPKPRQKPGRKPKPLPPGRMFMGMKQCHTKLGTTLKILQAIRVACPDYFHHHDVEYDNIKRYFDIHKEELEKQVTAKESKNTNVLKDERLILQNEYQKLKNAELKGELVSMEDLTIFLQTLGLKTSHILLQKLVTELPQRIGRMPSEQHVSICKEIYNEVVVDIQANIQNWQADQLSKQQSINESIAAN